MLSLIAGVSLFKLMKKNILLCFIFIGFVSIAQEKLLSKVKNKSVLYEFSETDLIESVRYHLDRNEYEKAKVFLENYYNENSQNLELNWLYASVLFLNNNVPQSITQFEKTLSLAPENKDLQKEYARSLYQVGDVEKVDQVLEKIVNDESTDVEFLLMKAKIDYWKGDILASKKTIKKIEQLYPDTDITADLSKEINQITSPYIKTNFEYQSDSQPLEFFGTNIELGQYRSKYLNPKLHLTNYNYFPVNEQALILKLSNEFYFDKLQLKTKVTGGLYKNFSGKTDWLGGVELTESFTKNLSFNVGYAKKSLLSTIVSTTYNLTMQDLYGALNYNHKLFAVHLAYSHQLYNNNAISSFISWIVSQPIKVQKLAIQFGYSYGYFDSEEILFVEENINDGTDVGIYNPYFTPNNQVNHAALLMMNYQLSSKLRLEAKANYGFKATFLNPFLYSTGETEKVVGFYKERNLKPKEFIGSIAYSFTDRFSVKGTYTYQETFFYDRNNINVGFNYIF